ncbi:armadillo-type protein [Phycomyces nitens]|nr:armadillo-type protein [Phycomyces nitens]
MADPRTQLLTVLHEAASQDYGRMRQAEEMLKQWENASQFFATLQDIFYDRSVHHDVRFLSGIYLKNGIDRFWRRTAKNPIAPEEKVAIRLRLLQFLDEPSKKLAAQNAIIVARIARLDFPNEWPELLPTLIQAIETTSSGDNEQSRIIHDRALSMLYEVLSELSTRLLSAGRKQFAALAPRTFQTIAQVYATYTERTIAYMTNINLIADPSAKARTIEELEITSTCLKCLRILMVSGIRDVHKYDETKLFIQMSQRHIQSYVDIHGAAQLGISSDILEVLETVIEDYGTLYLGLQKAHPVSLALCPSWVDILKYYWHNIVIQGDNLIKQHMAGQTKDPVFFQQFLLQGMCLVKSTIKTMAQNWEKTATDTLSVTDEETILANDAARMINEQFLTPEFVRICAETLVSKYMLLTPADFELWEEDPETWANHADTENWEFEMRPCAEMTFMTLLTQYRDLLCPIMLGLTEQVATVVDQQGLLFKDAVYCGLGLGVNTLYGKLDFELFVANRLQPEAANKEPSFKILRRRIAWLVGRWVSEGISADCRTIIYQILLQLMVAEEDLVVRLTAAHSLKLAIDDWDFDLEILLPYLGQAMDLLMALLNEAEESDTVMKLISDLNTIMDRTQTKIIPYAPKVIELLTPLWTRAQKEPLFQSSLVITFTKIAAILNDQSVQLQALLIPMVEYCVNKNNEAHVYLIDDALDLWWTLLQSTPYASPQMMELVPVAIELLDFDTENMRKVLKIIESYILLAPEATLQQYGTGLFGRLASYVGNSKAEVASNIVSTADLALMSVPIQMCGDALVQSGLLGSVLQTFIQEELYAYALMNYMSLFARLAIYDANLVIQFIQMAGQQLKPASTDFLGDLLDSWMDKFDNLSHPRTRKLTCMAFTNMVRTGNQTVLSRLPAIFPIWTDVLAETADPDSKEALLHNESDMEGDLAQLDESVEKTRKSELGRRDLVYTTDLVSMIHQALTECEASHGGSESFHQMYLSSVDPSLLEQVNQIMSAL